MQESFSLYSSWKELLQQLLNHSIKLDKERIEVFEKEVSVYCLPKNSVLTQLTAIMNDSRDYISTFEKYLEMGIHSFVEQRTFHLNCNKAVYVVIRYGIDNRLMLTNTRLI